MSVLCLPKHLTSHRSVGRFLFLVWVIAVCRSQEQEGSAHDGHVPSANETLSLDESSLALSQLKLGRLFLYLNSQSRSKVAGNGPPTFSPTPVTCHFSTQSAAFYLQSPKYPQNYPPNFDCYYHVKPLPDCCFVELEFLDFYLESVPGCLNDWLAIGHQKYCGYHPRKKVIVAFHGSAGLSLHFHSDAYHSFKGFYIVARQILCPRETMSPDVKQPSHPTGVGFPFPLTPFDSPANRPVYPPAPLSPQTNKPRPLAPYPVAPVLPIHDDVGPKYATPRPSDSPLSAVTPIAPYHPLERPCDVDLDPPFGTFSSVNYPHPYPKKLHCRIRFKKHYAFCTLELVFADFQLTKSVGCERDALVIGGNRYCASSLSNQKIRVPLVEPYTVVEFLSDSKTEKNRGYKANYRMLPCTNPTSTESPTTPEAVTCDRTFRDQESFVTSVNYPLPYMRNLECIYTIEKWNSIANELEIFFEDFNVEESANCRADFLEIGDNRYCGMQTGLVVNVPFFSNTFELRFVSNEEAQSTGFNIRIRQIDQQGTTAPTPTTPASSFCANQLFTGSEMSFLMVSPQFPLAYLADQHCTYTIIKASQDVCGLQLKFTIFLLPDADEFNNCREDVLEGGGFQFCGNLSGQTRRLPFFDRQLTFTFRSDSTSSDAEGYSIHVSQLTDCLTPLIE